VLADRLARAEQLAREGPVQDLRHEGALAAAGDTGDRRERAERELDIEVLEVVLLRALHDQLLAASLAALLRHGHRALAAQEGAGDGTRFGEDRVEPAIRDDLAAVLARAGPDIDHPVRGSDRLLVVFDHEDGVAEVAQARERRDQLCVVALVEPDRWLIEDVQHAHQRRPDLGREPDPLRLAAAERLRCAVDREVVQPDVDEEPEPRPGSP
jgi:hypothetical protein